MILSSGFSVVVYTVSVGPLHVEIKPPASGNNKTGAAGSAIPLPVATPNGSNTASRHPAAGTPAQPSGVNISELNHRIHQRIDQIQQSAIEWLVLLNVAVLVVGANLAYYLARRTLRPVELAMEAQAQFASDASHELRTPLTVMQSENEGALRLLDLTEPAKAVFKSNLEELAHLKVLSEGLLRLARDSGEVSLEPVWIDELAAQAKRHVAKFAQTKAIAICLAVPHLQAFADAPSLVQSIVILLDNAIQYSPEKSSVHIEGRTRGKRIALSVRDEGPGIASNDLQHIFDRFYRTEQSRRRDSAGHGLGLSLAKKLVEQQRGAITGESAVGKGSTFTIFLQSRRKSSGSVSFLSGR
jgi:signal transduction histidine kinase